MIVLVDAGLFGEVGLDGIVGTSIIGSEVGVMLLSTLKRTLAEDRTM